MRRVDLNGAKRRMKRVLALVGLGAALTASALPSQAIAKGHNGQGGGNGGGQGNGHKVG
jgi:hypothetical protein